MEWTKRFVGGFFSFRSALTLVVYNDKNAYRILAALPFKVSAPHLAPMSNELILQISCNIFLTFRWILMMRPGLYYVLRRHWPTMSTAKYRTLSSSSEFLNTQMIFGNSNQLYAIGIEQSILLANVPRSQQLFIKIPHNWPFVKRIHQWPAPPYQ